MKVVICHNFYQQPGGEDSVFADEVQLLRERGDEVIPFTLHNDAIGGGGGAVGRLRLMGETVWNGAIYRRLRRLVRHERPAVVHFHNTFPLMSPAAYYAARAGGAAVVQTLHNYRLLCPAATFLRDGRICEDCLHKSAPWPGVVHRCYRGSVGASAVTAGMLTFHRAIGTYRRAVDVYVALTEFARQKYLQGGLPADRVRVKPNFVGADRGVGSGGGGYGLYVGRLDPSKGLDLLLRAWAHIGPDARLRIVGDGPMAAEVSAAAAANPRIEWLGRRPLEEVYAIMGDAAFLLMSSQWYEAMPRTIVEAYSKGTPVIVPRLGAMAELIDHQRTGLHFIPGDARDLAAQVRWAFDHPAEMGAMRAQARREYEVKYTADVNYRLLRAIYDAAIRRRVAPTAVDPTADYRPAERLSLTVGGRALPVK